MIKLFRKLFGKKGTISFNYQGVLDNQKDYRGDINNPHDWGEEAKGDNYYVYHRIKKEFDNLKKEDYRTGFGTNSFHYSKVRKEREKLGLPSTEIHQVSYEHKSRDGFYDITGKLITSKYHPLHDKFLVDKETGEKYHIDIVSIGYYYGKIMTLVTRKEGSKSHGCIEWEIISGGDLTSIKNVKKNQEKYELVDKS
ncbi:MAG: hypothetical protein SLAVMIC_00625 [uncultured marine phage]|uniref:Uncharacterized protein n=1 Tax=uncultured marine phage TaxID=707152 RepID=A0A8D9CBV7_9VIRU|nr:MAG: hypothetical protein SLAVMIC_00625 [uncultured marine phage]